MGREEEEDGNKDFDAAMRRQMMKRRMAFEQRTATSRRGGADGEVVLPNPKLPIISRVRNRRNLNASISQDSDEGDEEEPKQRENKSGNETEEGIYLSAHLLEFPHHLLHYVLIRFGCHAIGVSQRPAPRRLAKEGRRIQQAAQRLIGTYSIRPTHVTA